MEDLLSRFWNDLVGRIDGPMKFRIFLQPLASIYFAYKAGKRDASSGEVPYFYGLLFAKGEKKALIKQGWKDVGKVFIMALVIDIIYQIVLIYKFGTQTTIYPVETIVTSIMLSFVPYLLFRGLFNRLLRKK